MAVAFDAVGPSAAGANSATASLTWAHTITGSNTVLLAACALDAGSDAGFSMSATYNGVAMTSLSVVHSGGITAGFLQVWGIIAAAGASHNVVVTAAGGTPSGLSGGSVSFTGAGQTIGAAFGTPATANTPAPATTASAALASNTTGNLIAGFACSGSSFSSATSPSTSRFIGGSGFSAAAGQSAGATSPSTGSSVTMAWTLGGSDDFAEILVEVLAAAAGAPAGSSPGPRIPPGRLSPMAWQYRSPVSAQIPAGAPSATVPAGLATGTGAALNTAFTYVQAGLPSGAGTAAVPVFGNYITGLAGSGNSYFVTNQGTPKLLVCDNPWALIPNAGRWGGTWQADIDNYCNSRGGQGFTGVYLDPLGNLLNSGVYANGRTFDGVTPFTTGTDPSSGLNTTFWARVDYFIAACARNNMAALVNIAYSGGSSSSANADMDNGGALDSKTSTQYTDYGSNLAARYAATPNIIWVVGNDYFGSYDTPFSNILTGLRGGGDTHLITIHNNAETSSRYDFGTGGGNAHEAWGFANAQVNGVYTYVQTYFGIEYALAETSPITTIWIDGYFYSTVSQDRTMRQFHWWAVASGARGTSTGSEAIWQWQSGAPAAVTTGAWYTTQNAVIRATIEPLTNWQNLQAAPGSAFITAGRGTRYGGTTSGGGGAQYGSAITDNYIAASLCADKSLAVIYFSAGTAASTITIDQTKLATGYTATWVDPASGAQTSGTPGATYANHGTNSAGDRDWVLILQAPPSTSASAGLASGTGTAQGNDPAIGVNAAAATETGAALSPVAAAGVNAVPATEAGAALSPAAAVAVNAVAATEAGAALGATASTTTSGTATATLASGAGAALSPAAAIGAGAVLPSGAGTARAPAVTTAASPAVTAATGTGTALNPAAAAAPTSVLAAGTSTALGATAAIAVTGTLASGAGTALNATASTVTSGTANATLATGAGAALNPAVAIAVTAAPAAGTGTALGATASTAAAGTAGATVATGAGTALNPAAAITYTAAATAATGTGAALGTVAASAASPAAAPATGTGAALSPAAAIGVGAVLATGTGTAQGATITATASPAAGLATGTGAALNAAVSTSTAGTANAALATGTGAAGSATPAVGAAAAAATEAGAALNATVSTAAFTNAQAGLASGAGAAQGPGLTLAGTATAAPATGTGATASAPAIGAGAGAASGAGTGRNATGQTGWVAPAGLAHGAGAAQSPVAVLVALAQAAAAAGLGAALRATAKTVTYGTARQGTMALAGAVAGQQAIPHAGDGQMPLPRAEGGTYP